MDTVLDTVSTCARVFFALSNSQQRAARRCKAGTEGSNNDQRAGISPSPRPITMPTSVCWTANASSCGSGAFMNKSTRWPTFCYRPTPQSPMKKPNDYSGRFC